MRRLVLALTIFGLLGAPSSASAIADEAERTALLVKLAGHRPDAVPLLLHAFAAVDEGDLAAAGDRLAALRKKAPRFDDATRLRCELELRRERRDHAVRLCRQALASEETVGNLRAMALALVMPRTDGPATDGELAEAADLAVLASLRAPDDIGTQLDLCDVALAAGDVGRLQQCVARLEVLSPDSVPTHYFAAWALGGQGRVRAGLRRLDEAHAAGLDDALYSEARADLQGLRSPLSSGLRLLIRVVGGWLLLLLGLFVTAELLSTATLRSASRLLAARGEDGQPSAAEIASRRAYRATLWACCAIWYVTITALAAGFFWLGATLLRWIVLLPVIPWWAAAVVISVLMYVAGALIRTLLARVDKREQVPGFPLRITSYPSLNALLQEVAHRVGTAPVDSVFLVPGATFAVFEQASTLRRLSGQSERCLVVGVALLEGLRVVELKAILAHEYGHFRGGDTAGDLAMSLRASMVEAAMSLAEAGLARWYNPAWWFVIGFHTVFMRVSLGASRLQEVLADRSAAVAYGGDVCARALRHVVRRSARFELRAEATVREVVDAKEGLRNLYAHHPTHPPSEWQMDKAAKEAMAEPPTKWDTHPPIAERIGWMEALDPAAESMPGDEADAWALFGDRDGVEVEMTRLFRRDLAAATGVSIPETVRGR